MCDSRKRQIEELTEQFRKLLEEKYPEKGSTLARIEELTEEIGQAIEANFWRPEYRRYRRTSF